MRHRITVHNDRNGKRRWEPLVSSFTSVATINLILDHNDPDKTRTFQIDLTAPAAEPDVLKLDIYPPRGYTMALGDDLVRNIQLIIAPEAPRT